MKTFLIIIVIIAAAALVGLVIRQSYKRSKEVSNGKNWMLVLRQHPIFPVKQPDLPIDIKFQYAHPTDENLKRLRETYNLETVAGSGTETERIINLMRWVHNLVGHASYPSVPEEKNAFSLIQLAKDGKQLNCYMHAIILNEVYLSMGFASRAMHLRPHSKEEEESHFVTSVYSRQLDKWLFMDADFGTYVMDEKGIILGVPEIRSRLISGAPLVVDPGMGKLKKAWDEFVDYLRGGGYLWYLSKNIFKCRCQLVSEYNQESFKTGRTYVELLPDGYREELLREPLVTPRGNTIISINNEEEFWQKPD